MAEIERGKIFFRAWFYFRNGWSLYFAFIFAAINTLTVTYYLAIENYPSLKTIFPSFELYILSVVFVGLPLLIIIGYVHFKRSSAYRSEAGVGFEVHPYHRRSLINSELNLELNLKILDLILKLTSEDKLTEDEINQRYSSYFPGKVNGVRDVLKMAGLKESSFNIKFLDEKEIVIKDL